MNTLNEIFEFGVVMNHASFGTHPVVMSWLLKSHPIQ